MNDDGSSPAARGPGGGGTEFNAYYFEHCCGRPYQRDEHWLRFFGTVADRIVEQIQPKRVLDAGCALGFLVETLRDRGVDAEGIDLSEFAISQVFAPVQPFCRVGSIADEFTGQYDLIVSIEVVEHMPQAEAEAAIANFCRHTDDVLFSSTPGDYREPTHVNVHRPEHWAELFARQGFHRDVDFDASFITEWAVRYRRRREPTARIIRDYERRFAEIAAERAERRQYAIDVQNQLDAALSQIRALHGERDADRESFQRDRETLERQHEADRNELVRERDALETELRLVREALEHTHADVTRKVLELDEANRRFDAVRAESDDRSHQLSHARETIRLMEQSIFWRVRRWFGRG